MGLGEVKLCLLIFGMTKRCDKMEGVVISIGGSVLVPDSHDADYIKSLVSLLKEISASYRLFIVTGGGKVARYYIKLGRALGISEDELDELGIGATRLNAQFLIQSIKDQANPKPAQTIEEAAEAGREHGIVIMGGTTPGHTTDAVSASLAEKVGAARLVNATNVDGVYDSDPKKNPDAKKFNKMSYDELNSLVSGDHGKAGPNVIFDPKGAKIIARMKIPLLVCNGRNIEALKNAILGKEFEGTTIL
jgi:uridylate kinase